MGSRLAVQPARHCPKCSFKCLCPDPSCSLQDKLPPLLSIQARALTLRAGWQASIGWSFINARQSCATAHPPTFPLLSSNPSSPSTLRSSHQEREIYGRTSAATPTQSPHPPQCCELRGSHKSYCPASEQKGGGGGGGERYRGQQEREGTEIRGERRFLLRLTKLIMIKFLFMVIISKPFIQVDYTEFYRCCSIMWKWFVHKSF